MERKENIVIVDEKAYAIDTNIRAPIEPIMWLICTKIRSK